MNCTTATELHIGYLKNELDAHVKVAYEEHLARCESCREKLSEARRILKWTESAMDQGTHDRIQAFMREAVIAGATDIHLQPTDDGKLRVRYRIDGVLSDQEPIEALDREGTINRIKLMANMGVSQIKTPQYGRIPVERGDRKYDFRVTVIPYTLGEGVCMRIFDSEHLTMTVDKIGLSDEDRSRFRSWITSPAGLVVVGGPMGSGKTTVVYTLINEVNSEKVNVVTVEDPVSYTLPGVSQAQVNRREGFTYGEGIRSLLMSDPDVIYVSDIPDLETARAISDAALTGHLCLANLSETSVFAMIDSLLRLGWDPFLMSSILLGLSNQRLVRCICKACAKPISSRPEELERQVLGEFFGLTVDEIRKGHIVEAMGCAECHNTGYRGRSALYETLSMSADLAQILVREGTSLAFKEQANREGFRSLREDAKSKILAGQTTLEEAFRVLSASF